MTGNLPCSLVGLYYVTLRLKDQEEEDQKKELIKIAGWYRYESWGRPEEGLLGREGLLPGDIAFVFAGSERANKFAMRAYRLDYVIGRGQGQLVDEFFE